MTTLHLELLVAERGRELRREAATARLVALARCCTPSSLARAARRLAALRRDRSAAVPCCA